MCIRDRVHKVPCVPDDTKSIARDNTVENTMEGAVHFKVEFGENYNVLLNPLQCQLDQFLKAGTQSPHIFKTASAFLSACPFQVVVKGEDDEVFKQLVQCAREFCRVAVKGYDVADHQQEQRYVAEPLDVGTKGEGRQELLSC